MLDPGSDSDLSDLCDDEDQDITMKNIKCKLEINKRRVMMGKG